MSASDPEQKEPPADSAWGHHSPSTELGNVGDVKPATPEEFKEITGVDNDVPDALGVGISPSELQKLRQPGAVSGDTPNESTSSAPDPSKA